MTIEDLKNSAIQIEKPNIYISGKELKKFRISLNMSQAVFADYLGVSKQTLINWELDRTSINKTALKLIYLIRNNKDLLNELKIISYKKEAIFKC